MALNTVLTCAIAGAVLTLSLAASTQDAAAAPGDYECLDCGQPGYAGNNEPAARPQQTDRQPTVRPQTARPARGSSENADRAPPANNTDCENCPPQKQYDNVEVIKSSRDVDNSRVINTTTVVPVHRRVRETNKLIVRENETRNVGVVQHNHTIIEKEIRYVRRPPVQRHVNYVLRTYQVIEPVVIQVPAYVLPERADDCSCHWWNRYR